MDRFWLFWLSASVSYLGDGIRFAALPLLAATLSPTPADVASVAVAAGLPWLIFGLLAGPLVDRLPRLPLMSVMQLARTAVTFTIVALVATESISIPFLVALAFFLGTCEVFYDVASHAVLPQIVEANRIQSANSRLMTAEIATFKFVGPVVGAALFSVAVVIPFTLDAATFAISTLLLLSLVRRVPGGTTAASKGDEGSSVVQEFREGLRWFKSQRLIRSLTFLAAGANLGISGFYAVLVLLAQEELGLQPTGYGLLITVGALGAVGAGLVADRLSSDDMRRGVCLVSGPLIALCILVASWSDNVVITASTMVVLGGIVMFFNVIAMSLRQLITPDHLLGRVMSVHRFLCWGAMPAGGVLAGLLGEVYGVRTAIAVGGIVILVSSTFILPDLWRSRGQYSGTSATHVG